MDIDPNKLLGGLTFANLILWFLALGGLIAVIDYIGIMPSGIAKWLARNRLETTLKSLKQLGVRVCWNEEANTINILERALSVAHIKELAYKIHLRRLLEEDTFEGNVNVGATRMFSSDSFVDVMGGSTNASRAIDYAKILMTHAGIELIGDFDVVASPKEGSPILGYEFARLAGKPLVLGVLKKVQDLSGRMGMHAQLDYLKSLSLKNKKVLLIDDSTTGGRKMADLVEALRKEGAIVTDALVLFEPKGKGARQKLAKLDIRMHAVVDGPEGRF